MLTIIPVRQGPDLTPHSHSTLGLGGGPFLTSSLAVRIPCLGRVLPNTDAALQTSLGDTGTATQLGAVRLGCSWTGPSWGQVREQGHHRCGSMSQTLFLVLMSACLLPVPDNARYAWTLSPETSSLLWP